MLAVYVDVRLMWRIDDDGMNVRVGEKSKFCISNQLNIHGFTFDVKFCIRDRLGGHAICMFNRNQHRVQPI